MSFDATADPATQQPYSPADAADQNTDNQPPDLQSALQAAPQQAPPDLPGPQPDTKPSFKPGFIQRVVGALEGEALGGVMGAVTGAVNPRIPAQEVTDQQQAQSARVKFMSELAAGMAADTAIKKYSYARLPQDTQRAIDSAGQQQLIGFAQQGIQPDLVLDDRADAVKAAYEHFTDTQGGVPSLAFVHANAKLHVFNLDQLSQNGQGFKVVNGMSDIMQTPSITFAQWQKMKPGQQIAAEQSAMSFFQPISTPANNGTMLEKYKALRQTFAAKNPDDRDTLSRFDSAIQSLQSQGTTFQKERNTKQQQADQIRAQQKAARDAQGNNASEWRPKVTSDEKKKAELSENIAHNVNEIATILINKPEIVGVIAGRFTSVEQMMGTNDPAISALGTEIHNIAMANSGVHGFRSQEGVANTEKLLLNNFKNGPQAIAGALKALQESTQTFIDVARPDTYRTHSKQGGARKGMRGQ